MANKTTLAQARGMETNMAVQGELIERGAKLLEAARAFWEVHQKLAGPRAVVWLTDTNGELVLFTRGEYREQIFHNIMPISEEMPLDEPFLIKKEPISETTKRLPENEVAQKSKPTTDYLDDLLAKKEPQTNREHILKALSVKIQTPIPDDGRAYDKWEKGLDSLIGECRSHAKKRRLDDELTKDIIAAIHAAKSEKGGFPFETSDQPHTAVVARIVKAFRNREWVVASPYAGVRDL